MTGLAKGNIEALKKLAFEARWESDRKEAIRMLSEFGNAAFDVLCEIAQKSLELEERKFALKMLRQIMKSGLVIERFPQHLYEVLPNDIKKILDEAIGCYENGFCAASSVMFRKVLECSIFIKFRQEGKEAELFDKNGNPIELKRRIELAKQWHFIASELASELVRVKWFGDAGAHSFNITIAKEDLPNISVLIRLTLEQLFHK